MYIILFFVLGCVFGSFLNVIIYRLPIMLREDWRESVLEFFQVYELQMPKDILHKEAQNSNIFNLAWPNSHCPKCKKPLAFWQNIPVLSFIFLRGKCFYCKQKISWQYPLVEFFSGLLFVVLAQNFFYLNLPLLVFLAILCLVLLAISLIDLKHFIIPNILSLGLFWLALIYNFVFNGENFAQFFYGGIFGYVGFWLLANIMQILLKKPALGYGDIKLFAALGASFGWQSIIPLAFMSALLGIVAFLLILLQGKKTFGKLQIDGHIPFGPFIALSAFIFIIFNTFITSFFQSWFLSTQWVNLFLI